MHIRANETMRTKVLLPAQDAGMKASIYKRADTQPKLSYRHPLMAEREQQYLPEDIVVRIFSRLPVKSLIRFTCLSKRWHFIILSDPVFAKSQFQFASQHRSITRRLLSNAPKSDSEPKPEFQLESIDLGDNGSSSSLRKLNCPFLQQDYTRYDYRLCTCNGLVCILSLETVHIWNPSTGFYKKLPQYDGFHFLGYCSFGFGYVSSVDDYKVIAPDLIFVKDNEGRLKSDIAENIVMSLKANNWKNMGPNSYQFNSDSVLLNESLHWVNGDRDIVVFDLAKEEFRTMLLPVGIVTASPLLDMSCPSLDISCSSLVISVGGCLCLMNSLWDSLTEVWVMKEYDVIDSWTKLFSLDFRTHPGFYPLSLVRVTETSAWVELYEAMNQWSDRNYRTRLIRSGHDEEEICMVSNKNLDVIEYQETLLWLP